MDSARYRPCSGSGGRLCGVGIGRRGANGRTWRSIALGLAGILVGGSALARPLPTAPSKMTITYETGTGVVSYSDVRHYGGRLGDQTPFGAAPNISAFNSAGSELGVFGRRAAPILLNNPTLPSVFRWNESLVTHAFFKIDNGADFFPGFAGGKRGLVTVTIEGIHFPQPVIILEDTLMLHAKWWAEQVDELFFLTDEIYVHLNNHHTASDPFRDFDTFFSRLFFDSPTPNYVLNDPDLHWSITGNGTDTLALTVTFPYEILKNLEASRPVPPSALPAPEGFLEPYHFHIEYVVAPATAYPMPAPTTLRDFFRGGSQPGVGYEQILHSRNCGICHGNNDETILVNKPWAGSAHALAGRDPLFFAFLAIAEQDAPSVGDMCLRCHVPRAWLWERCVPTDGSAINASDRDGVSCHFCHRMVDPFYEPGVSPVEDAQILANLVELPVTNDSATYIMDPADRRRSSRGVPTVHANLLSPFHNDSRLCETCHDVSKPTLDRQPNDTYMANPFNERHPTGNKYDMYPVQRTFSEWSMSEYAKTGVDAGGRFGGNKQVVSSCQDCHMPDTTSRAAENGPIRSDMADHGMYGGSTWIPLVVANLYPNDVDPVAIQTGMAGCQSMLERAASLELTQSGDSVNVRVINETGHKLPTGEPDTRLIWINVKFFDGDGQLIAERGAYDNATAKPTRRDTKVYEVALGLNDMVASMVGLPSGPSFHLPYCNIIHLDNRIPPRGFTNEAFRQIQAPVVGAVYADGQYWDDTLFVLPTGSVNVNVALYYKSATTEFIEFLRDANRTNDVGQILYDQWMITGKSPPVEMVTQTIDVNPFEIGDFDGDSLTNLNDIADFVSCIDGPAGGPTTTRCQPGDLDRDEDVDLRDTARFQRRFGSTK